MRDRRRLIILLSLIVLVVVVIASLVLPPVNFPTDSVIEITAGSSTSQIADLLYQNNVIRSPKVFELIALRQAAVEHLQAGFYQFEKPLTIEQVVERLENGFFSDHLIKLTVPEGLSLPQLADLINKNFPQIDQDNFITIASSSAGFLFPDTYLLPSGISAEQLVRMMRDNFTKQTKALDAAIEKSGRSLEEIVIMASLVEAEAKTRVDRAIIAGILWKRFDQKMKLEVDVATSTYQSVGLPSAPIVSPGLESIKAVLNPTTTPYLFYLSDKSGQMHYAQTFVAHKLNIDKYLKK